MDLHIIQPWLLWPLVFAFGLLIGSFLNVIIHRVPKIMQQSWTHECTVFLNEQDSGLGLNVPNQPHYSIAWPASHCPKCQAPLKFYENIPVLSYLIQKGACRHCKAPISARYLGVELLTGLMTLTVVMHFGLGWVAWLALLFTWSLVALSFIDLEHQLLPDQITLSMLWLGLFVNSFGVFASPTDAIYGAIVGYLSLWSVYQLFKLLTGKEGMGFGDFKLLAMLGAWLGWQALPLIILLSSLVGAVVGILMIVIKRHDSSVPIPFGPYIAMAGWIGLLFGDMLLSKYFSIIGLTLTL